MSTSKSKFGDPELIRKNKHIASSFAGEEQILAQGGKRYQVRVNYSYTVVESDTALVTVLAVDEDDAEERAKEVFDYEVEYENKHICCGLDIDDLDIESTVVEGAAQEVQDTTTIDMFKK